MKRLILVRHAKSSWQNPDLEDIDRPLKKRGERDAPMMGQRLRSLQIKPDLLISSPAVRAMTTAQMIAEQIGYPVRKIATERSLYGSGWNEIMNTLTHTDDEFNEIMLFGHNPDFTTLASRLCAFSETIPTCGVVCIDLNVASWKHIEEGCGKLAFFDYPKKAK
ncbi:histidine phosphatase family protein [candidate division KSB1 bacterium]|nr:histidine phosphatase family protein [candidate division KSB1 bacterium]